MIGSWVLEDNLRAFLTSLGWFVAYNFDPDDWQAIEAGLRNTDGDQGRWYEYEFHGKEVARLRLAKHPGSAVVAVEVEIDDRTRSRVEAAIAIFQHFELRDPA